jgi:uncharacterized membrane protein YbaN (DUF454 family)
MTGSIPAGEADAVVVVMDELPRRVKWFAAVMMAMSGCAMLVVTPLPRLAGVALLVAAMAAILVWLWRRPGQRPPPS